MPGVATYSHALRASAIRMAGITNPACLDALACREALAVSTDLALSHELIALDYQRVVNDIHGDT